MKIFKKQTGFALFQVLIMAILVFGMMYLFTKMNQTTQKQLDQKNSGKTAAIIMNSLLNETVNNNKCVDGDSYPLKNCVYLSSALQEKLKTMDMDPDQSTVTVKDELDL